MATKPIKSLELHYTMIQFFNKNLYTGNPHQRSNYIKEVIYSVGHCKINYQTRQKVKINNWKEGSGGKFQGKKLTNSVSLYTHKNLLFKTYLFSNWKTAT